MGDFLERYRYAIGSSFLVLVIFGAIFLLWRDNVWKPTMEKRLDILESEIIEFQNNQVYAAEAPTATTEVNPGTLLPGSSTVAKPKTTTKSTSSKSTSASSSAAKSSAPASSVPTASATTALAKPVIVYPININTATAQELDDGLVGIGPSLSAAIVEWRNIHGLFKSVDGLDDVPGIGPATINKFRDKVTI